MSEGHYQEKISRGLKKLWQVVLSIFEWKPHPYYKFNHEFIKIINKNETYKNKFKNKLQEI